MSQTFFCHCAIREHKNILHLMAWVKLPPAKFNTFLLHKLHACRRSKHYNYLFEAPILLTLIPNNLRIGVLTLIISQNAYIYSRTIYPSSSIPANTLPATLNASNPAGIPQCGIKFSRSSAYGPNSK